MCRLLDGTLGIGCGCSFCFLAAAPGDLGVSEAREAGLKGLFVACDTTLEVASSLSLGSGGGLGDMETEVTEAEWAW